MGEQEKKGAEPPKRKPYVAPAVYDITPADLAVREARTKPIEEVKEPGRETY